jgi:hypothetical protein
MKTLVRRMPVDRTYPNPPVECMVELDIDEDKLFRLASKALRNKTKRTKQFGIELRVRPTKGEE